MAHKWNFFKTSHLVQASVKTGDDLKNLKNLDQKLWTVLSMSVDGLVFDKKTLEFLDTDKDGRIRAPELLAAIDWLDVRLKSLDVVFDKSSRRDALKFDSINSETPEGKELLKSLKEVAAQNGKSDATETTLEEVTSIGKIFAGTAFNGDGIITPLSTAESELSEIISAIGKTQGTMLDRSGENGINQEKIDAFFKDASSYVAWTDEGKVKPEIFFLGENTTDAYNAYAAVKDVVDGYLIPTQEVETFVMSAPDPILDSNDSVNIKWRKKIAAFFEKTVGLLGEADATKLSVENWIAIKDKFAPYEAWLSSKSGANVESIGYDKLAKWLDGGKIKSQLDELVVKDLALSNAFDRLVDAEKAIRYVMNFEELISNYVNQANLYDPEKKAIFQVGTLYVDSRACDLCFYVANESAHSAMAANSKCCILYVKLSRKGTSETKNVCAVVTDGKTFSLYAGRNGIFYDRDGKDWDAVITKVVEAQVSLKEAFWAPWRKLFSTVSDQAKKFLSTKQAAATSQVSTSVDKVSQSPNNAGNNGAALASSVAALSVGIGMLGAAFAGLIGLIAGLPLWKVVLGLGVVVLTVSLPSVILTWFKLRARDLGVVLNACGWAVNRPLYFGIKLAKMFTSSAKLPFASRVARDPYKSNWFAKFMFVVILLGVIGGAWWYFNCKKRCEKNACEKPTAEKVVEAKEGK